MNAHKHTCSHDQSSLGALGAQGPGAPGVPGLLGWDMGKGRPGPCPHSLRQLWLFPLGQHRPPAQGPHTTCRATLWMPSPDKIGGQGSVPPGESGEGFSETEWWRDRMPWIRHQLQPPKCWGRFKLVKWYLCFLLPSPGTEEPTPISPLILTKRPNHSCETLAKSPSHFKPQPGHRKWKIWTKRIS